MFPIAKTLSAAFVIAALSACFGSSGSKANEDAATQDATQDATPDATDNGVLNGHCQNLNEEYSFFATSMDALWKLSGDDISDLSGGFGGNFGGLSGADEICQKIGAATGHGHRTWRAFLSVTDDGNGNPVNAIDRIGVGPWVDANGRTVATSIAGVLSGPRPDGDAQTVEDLPDECGVPLSALGNAHDIVTGSDRQGRLADLDMESTCNNWTSSDDALGSSIGSPPVMCGHSYPRSANNGRHWLSDHPLRGCGKGANLINNGPGKGTCIGCSGGFGGIYCFAADAPASGN